jgi:hypothetical protein
MLNTEEEGTQFSTRLSSDENVLIAFSFANSSIAIGHSKNAAVRSPARIRAMACDFFTVWPTD